MQLHRTIGPRLSLVHKPMDSDDVSLENFGRQSVGATLEASPSVLPN